MSLSVNTVGNHLQRAMNKLSAHSKLEALVVALRLGLVRFPTGPAGGLAGGALRSQAAR